MTQKEQKHALIIFAVFFVYRPRFWAPVEPCPKANAEIVWMEKVCCVFVRQAAEEARELDLDEQLRRRVGASADLFLEFVGAMR